MKKGYTFIELLVTIAIVAIVLTLVITLVIGGLSYKTNNPPDPWLFPRQAQAYAQQEAANAQRELAKQIAEQNRLMQEALKEKETNK